jgi:hypothetical protein
MTQDMTNRIPTTGSKRNGRVVAGSVILLGLVVAGLLVWKAANDSPAVPAPSATTTSTTTASGSAGTAD